MAASFRQLAGIPDSTASVSDSVLVIIDGTSCPSNPAKSGTKESCSLNLLLFPSAKRIRPRPSSRYRHRDIATRNRVARRQVSFQQRTHCTYHTQRTWRHTRLHTRLWTRQRVPRTIAKWEERREWI